MYLSMNLWPIHPETLIHRVNSCDLPKSYQFWVLEQRITQNALPPPVPYPPYSTHQCTVPTQRRVVPHPQANLAPHAINVSRRHCAPHQNQSQRRSVARIGCKGMAPDMEQEPQRKGCKTLLCHGYSNVVAFTVFQLQRACAIAR